MRSFSVCTVSELVEQYQDLKNRLEFIDHATDRVADLITSLEQQCSTLMESQSVLTKSRKIQAQKLQTKIANELRAIGMPNTKLIIQLVPVRNSLESFSLETLGQTFVEQWQGALNKIYQALRASSEKGQETAKFLLQFGKETPKLLNKAASGGELSRLLLALKRVLSKNKQVTLIFDEIDQGLSGKVADQVEVKYAILRHNPNYLYCILYK